MTRGGPPPRRGATPLTDTRAPGTAHAGCTTNKSGTCSGTLDDFSFDADYRLSKRFDAFAGVMYSGVHDGLANGYLFHTTDLTTTLGVRFKF